MEDDDDDIIKLPAGPGQDVYPACSQGLQPARPGEHCGKARAQRRRGGTRPALASLHGILFHAESVSVVLEDAFKMMRAYF